MPGLVTAPNKLCQDTSRHPLQQLEFGVNNKHYAVCTPWPACVYLNGLDSKVCSLTHIIAVAINMVGKVIWGK